MATKPLSQATKPELADFAVSNGLDSSGTADEIRAGIRAAMPDVTSIPVADTIITAPSGRLTANYRDDPVVMVRIGTDSINTADHPVSLTCNGDTLTVNRNEDVAIPYRFYESCLKNAVRTKFKQTGDHLDEGMAATNEYAVPHTVLAMPAADEIAAFHDRTKTLGLAEKEEANRRRREKAYA